MIFHFLFPSFVTSLPGLALHEISLLTQWSAHFYWSRCELMCVNCKQKNLDSWLWYTKLLSMPKAVWWSSGKTGIWTLCNLTERGWLVFKVKESCMWILTRPVTNRVTCTRMICAFEEYWPGHHTIRVVSSVTKADFQKSHCFHRWLSTHARGLPWNSS